MFSEEEKHKKKTPVLVDDDGVSSGNLISSDDWKIVAEEEATSAQLDALLEKDLQDFYLKADLHELIKAKTWTYVLTGRFLYKFSHSADISQPRKKKPLLDIHSVEADVNDPCSFYVYTYKSTAKLNLNKVKGFIGLGMNFDSFLQRRQYSCSSALERFQWVFTLQRLVRNIWQRIFEDTIVLDPEIYQHHFFVIKLNRKGVSQERMLVISTAWLYNIEVAHNPTRIVAKKWAIPISSIASIVLVDTQQVNVTVDVSHAKVLVDDSHLGAKGNELNEAHSFLLHSPQERATLVSELQRLYEVQPGVVDSLKVIDPLKNVNLQD